MGLVSIEVRQGKDAAIPQIPELNTWSAAPFTYQASNRPSPLMAGSCWLRSSRVPADRSLRPEQPLVASRIIEGMINSCSSGPAGRFSRRSGNCCPADRFAVVGSYAVLAGCQQRNPRMNLHPWGPGAALRSSLD